MPGVHRVCSGSIQLTSDGRIDSFVEIVCLSNSIASSHYPTIVRGPTDHLGLEDIQLIQRTRLDLGTVIRQLHMSKSLRYSPTKTFELSCIEPYLGVVGGGSGERERPVGERSTSTFGLCNWLNSKMPEALCKSAGIH